MGWRVENMDPAKIELRELLKEVYTGKIVIPDFQRSFVWYPEDVRELLVSIVGGYYIDSILWLETTYSKDPTLNEAPFALRLIEGVKEVNPQAKIQSVVKVILDGQQRITSLFYAFYQPEIPLRESRHPHRFYLDIEKALNGEWEDAVISKSTFYRKEIQKLEEDENIIAFSDLRDLDVIIEKFSDHPKFREIMKIASRIVGYKVHVVTLPADTPLEKIVETFERINRTGLLLSLFDLLTARLYNHGIKLRELLKQSKGKYEFIKYVKEEFILKTIALIRGIEPKRANVLNLSQVDFERDWETACKMLELAYRRTKDSYGVLEFDKWMPYTTMLIPMAAMIHFLKKNSLDTKENYEKIDRWYWASVFSKRYDQAVDTKSFRDLKDFKEWILNGKVPNFITKFNINEVDLDVESSYSAIHKAVLCLIALKGALDFRTGQSPKFEIEKVQIDHIFPKSMFKDNRVVVKTLISTNQKKSSKRPSKYFKELIESMGKEKVKEILKTHLIPEEALDCLLRDDIECFIKMRKRAILTEIKKRVDIGYKLEA